jgi:hypothetical protein
MCVSLPTPLITARQAHTIPSTAAIWVSRLGLRRRTCEVYAALAVPFCRQVLTLLQYSSLACGTQRPLCSSPTVFAETLPARCGLRPSEWVRDRAPGLGRFKFSLPPRLLASAISRDPQSCSSHTTWPDPTPAKPSQSQGQQWVLSRRRC